MKTRFVVTIDTEEEGLWEAERSRRGTTGNVAHLPELADLAAECGVALTLLVQARPTRCRHDVGTADVASLLKLGPL